MKNVAQAGFKDLVSILYESDSEYDLKTVF